MELFHALREGPRPEDVPVFDVPSAPRRRAVGVMAEAGGWDWRRSIPPELPGVKGVDLRPGAEGAAEVVEAAARVRSLDLWTR